MFISFMFRNQGKSGSDAVMPGEDARGRISTTPRWRRRERQQSANSPAQRERSSPDPTEISGEIVLLHRKSEKNLSQIATVPREKKLQRPSPLTLAFCTAEILNFPPLGQTIKSLRFLYFIFFSWKNHRIGSKALNVSLVSAAQTDGAMSPGVLPSPLRPCFSVEWK